MTSESIASRKLPATPTLDANQALNDSEFARPQNSSNPDRRIELHSDSILPVGFEEQQALATMSDVPCVETVQAEQLSVATDSVDSGSTTR